MREPRSEPRRRGVRLSDLDRSLVYRIAFIGRRWEVLGPEDAPPSHADAESGGSASRGAASTPPDPPGTAGDAPPHPEPPTGAGDAP